MTAVPRGKSRKDYRAKFLVTPVYPAILQGHNVKGWQVCNYRNVVCEFCVVTNNCSRYASLPIVNIHAANERVLHYLENPMVYTVFIKATP